MACKIIRNQDTGKIDYVTAPNGERSELFDKIRDNSPNLSDDNLLREYAKYYVDKPEYNLDQNQNIDNSDITFKIDPFGKSIDNIRVDLKGNDIGYVQISKNNTTKILTVTGIELKEKGNGKKVYIKLRDTYPDFTIKSDPVNLSPDAINMWDSLVRNNLAIKNGEKDYTLLQGNSDPIYYRLDEPQKEKAIQQLDDYLLNFLDNFGVTSKDISEFKALKGIDALGVTDTLNKVIYFAQNRDSYTIPEEAAHMLIMLMGKNHPDIKALLDRIESWEGFQQVYNDYINVYDNPMKVKIEAAAKLLSEALVGNYKEVGLDKTLIDRVLESVNNILNTLRSLINKMAGVFLEPGDKIFNFVDNPSWSYHIADKIALNILKGNKDYVFKIPDNIRRVRPVETLKANEFAREFIEDVTDNYVTKLTGSVALAAQGEVYRESEDYLHDLDFTVLWDHNSWSQILKPFLDTKYKMLLVNSFWNSDQNTVQYLVMPLNSESEKVRVLKSPDDKIMIENLPEIYTYVDFFFGGYSGTRADINEGKQYEAWENIILAKQSFSRDNIFMSRPKDQQDYVLFSNIGDSRYVDPKNIFYRLDKNGELLAVEHDLDNIDLKYDYKSTDEGDVMNISFTYDDTEIGNAELNVDDNSWNLDAISIYPPYQGKKIGSYVTKLIAKDAAKADAVLKVEKTSPAGKNLQLRLQEDGYMKYDPATDSFSSTIFPSWYLSQESDLLDGNSSKGFVDSMSNQMNYYYHNQLANELKPNLSNINIAENEELTQNANSYYDASSNTIFLAPSLDLFTKYNAFLNSYFKASVINTLQGKDSLSKELLTDIFDDVKLRLRQAGIDQIIDLRNSPELINSLFSDTYFIEVLKKTPALDKYNNLIGDDIEYPSLYMQILKVIANENKLSNIQLPILDQILSTQAELLRSNNDVQLDYSVYFNTDVVEDTSISGMTYDDLVDLYEASKLEPTNTDNFSNFPKGTKKSTTKKDALKQFRFTKEQKEAAAKFQETASRIKEARIVSIEEVEKAAKGSALKNVKLLKKFVDKTVRYIITDTEGREIIVPLRPSDLGKIEFAKNRKFDRAEIELMDSSRDNIIARGMGTTLHGIQELIINELEKQNEDGLLLSNYTLGNANDFYKKQYSKFLSKIDNGELKKIWDSLNKKGTYTREFSKEELLGITDTDIADSDRKFTIDKADFDNLASLAFKLYHQIYERQAQLDSNSSVKHRPMILTETKVLNEDEGIAGSLDVLVIYQDKDTPKYGFYDYKFISFNREMNLSNKPADAETIKKQKLETTYTRRDGTVVSKEAANIKGRDYNEYAVRDKLRAKYSSFNHQVTAYKDALLKGYSLKKDQILESRVIPVNMVLKTVKTGNIITRTDETGKVEKINETKIVPTINFIDHDHDLLSQIPFAGELTDDSKINQFLEQLLAKRDKLFKTIKVRPGDEKLQKQLQDIEFIIKSLQLKKDIKAISERLLYIAKDVEKAITRPKMLGNKNNPLYYSDTDLVFAEDMLNFYSNFQESVAFEYDRLKRENENTKDAVKNSNFKDIEEALTNQNLKISVLLEKLKSVREQRLLDYADSTVAVELEDNFKVDLSVSSTDLKNMGLGSKAKESLFSDISGIQSWVYGISDWDNPITYMAKQIFDNINYEVKAYTESVTSKIEKQRDNLRKYADRRGISPIKVWDIFIDNYYGNTGRFVSQLSQDFYKKKNEAITKKDIKWLKENLIFDKDRYAKQYEKEKARLLKSYGVEDLTKEPEKAKIINGKLKAFESRFNMDLSDNAYYNRNNYFWKVSPATSSKWESEKWKIIKANPELLEFHTFYLDMIEEIKELTGESRINRSFIPQVHKDTVDILSKDFFSFDAVKNLYKSFVATSKIRTEDEVVGLVIDEEVINEVPFKFVDEVHVENLLTDLTKSLMLLAYSAKNYQLANAAKGTLEAIKLTIADTKFTEKTMYGNKKKGKLVKGEISNLYAGYTKQLGYHIYGQTLQSSKFNSTVGSAGDINIAKVLRKVMHFYSQKSLAFNTKSIIGGHFNVKAQLRQIAKKGNHYTLKNLNKMETVFASLNKNAHIFNEIFKVSQEGNAGLIWEQANRLSISKLRQMWSKPISFYLQRRSDDAMDAHLLYSMLDNYVLHPDGKTIFPLSKKNKYLKGTKWENTELKTMWDSLLIDEATGDDVPNMKIMSFDGSTQMTKLQFMQFRQRVRTLMARARGNASNEDIANYRNTLEGQLLGQFKAWIPTTLLLERTGQARYNYSLDELEIGRYRVFLGESFKGMIPRFSTFAKMLGAVALFKSKNLADIEISRGIYNKWRIDNPELSDKVTFEEFIKTRSDQLAAMAAELRIYLMVWLGLLGIGFAAGDDERKKNPFVRTLTTHMERVLLEIGFYFDPSQTVQIITRGPIPLFNMVVELKNLMANSIGEMQDLVTGTDADKKISFLTPGDEPFTLNIWEEETDKTGPFTYTFRFVPGLKGINDLLQLINKPQDKPTLLEWLFSDDNYKYR